MAETGIGVGAEVEVADRRARPTVRDVLAVDALAQGRPEVVAGADYLDRPVRWVHVSEVADIGRLLEGGELILTTGIAIPDAPPAQRRYVQGLAAAGCAGLVIELGRAFRVPPPALCAAAEQAGLPLVALHREVRFVRITEAVHELIVTRQVSELRLLDRVHRVFTELSVDGARPATIVSRVAEILGAPTILEDAARRVVAYASSGDEPSVLLARWEERSRAIPAPAGPTAVHAPPWLVAPVEARGERWGRLLVRLGQHEAGTYGRTVVERAATALAINRLIERDRETLEQQSHRTLVADILRGAGATDELDVRARALGVALAGRRLCGVVVRTRGTITTGVDAEVHRRELTRIAADGLSEAQRSGLVGSLGPAAVALLVTLPGRGVGSDGDRWLDVLATTVHEQVDSSDVVAPVTIGIGSTVARIDSARRSLQEAQQVAAAAVDARPGRLWHRLDDLGVRGLLHVLAGDERIEAFIDRELGALTGSQEASDALATLRAYLESGGHKSQAADRLDISRGTLYARLEAISQRLEVDLEDPEVRLSLHLAVLARDRRHQAATA